MTIQEIRLLDRQYEVIERRLMTIDMELARWICDARHIGPQIIST